MGPERCVWSMGAWWFPLKTVGRGRSSPTPRPSSDSTCRECVRAVLQVSSEESQTLRSVLLGFRGCLLQAFVVPLEIGHRELDGQVDDVRSPRNLRIDGPTLNPEERGPMFLFVPER